MDRRDKIVRRDVSVKKFYGEWLLWLRPLHKLTDREMEIAALMLECMQYLSSKVRDEAKRGKIVTSIESRKAMSDMIGMSDQYFGMLYGGLRKKGFIIGDVINPLFIPRIESGDSSYAITINFVFHE